MKTFEKLVDEDALEPLIHTICEEVERPKSPRLKVTASIPEPKVSASGGGFEVSSSMAQQIKAGHAFSTSISGKGSIGAGVGGSASISTKTAAGPGGKASIGAGV